MVLVQLQQMFSQFLKFSNYGKEVEFKVANLQIVSQDLLSKEDDLFSLLMDLHQLEDYMTSQHHLCFFFQHHQINFDHFHLLILDVIDGCGYRFKRIVIVCSYLYSIWFGLFDCDFCVFLIVQEDQNKSQGCYQRLEQNFSVGLHFFNQCSCSLLDASILFSYQTR